MPPRQRKTRGNDDAATSETYYANSVRTTKGDENASEELAGGPAADQGSALLRREPVNRHRMISVPWLQLGGGEIRLVRAVREVLGFQAEGPAMRINLAALAM